MVLWFFWPVLLGLKILAQFQASHPHPRASKGRRQRSDQRDENEELFFAPFMREVTISQKLPTSPYNFIGLELGHPWPIAVRTEWDGWVMTDLKRVDILVNKWVLPIGRGRIAQWGRQSQPYLAFKHYLEGRNIFLILLQLTSFWTSLPGSFLYECSSSIIIISSLFITEIWLLPPLS